MKGKSQSLIDFNSLQTSIPKVQEKMSKHIHTDGSANFLLGMTGSGKSTFINFMMDRQFTYEKNRSSFILKPIVDGDQNLPKIGHTKTSCTEVPEVYEFGGIVWHDPAGFLDTKGIEQEILNAYCNAKMFRRGSRARIILVIEYSSLMANRGGGLIQAAERICELFGEEYQSIIHSCAIVISKTENDYTEEYGILDILDIYEGFKTQCKAKILLEAIYSHKRVFLFPKPPGVTKQIQQKIKEQIMNIREFLITSDACISLSSEAKRELEYVCEEINKQIIDQSKKIDDVINDKFGQALKDVDVLEKKILQLKEAKDILNSKQITNGSLPALKELLQKLQVPENKSRTLFALYNQAEFFATLHSKFKSISKIQQRLLQRVKECISKLESALEKLASKLQMEKILRKHEQELQLREKKLEAERYQKMKEFQAREERLSKMFMEQTTALKQLMVKISTPSPPPPQSSCQIM